MANQPETASYAAGVYQLEIADSVDGGVGAKSNAPLLALASRTAYLKAHMDSLEAGTMVPPGFALLNSPNFTGSPTGPTQAVGDNTTKLATTAFVQATVNSTITVDVAGAATTTLTQAQWGPAIIKLTGAITANKAVVLPNISGHWQVVNNSTGAFTITLKTAAGTGVVLTAGMSSNIYCDGTNVTLQQTDFISPALTGIPTAPTAVAATNTTQIATTAYVQQAANGMLTKSVAGGVDVTLSAAEAGYATMKFTGALTANINVIVPTTTNSWRIINATTGAFTLNVKTAAGTGTGITQGLTWGVLCDGVNVIDGITDFYSVALTGVPTAPTAAPGASSTQIATTAFVTAADNLKANNASPSLTGTPLAPTAVAGTATTQLATTAFVQAAANGMLTKSVAGGVTVTLTAAEAGNAILKFTGALTASIAVVVPTATGTWTVINATTGAFTLTVKTLAGTGIAITQGLNWGVVCDGVNVIDAITDFYSVAMTGVPTTPTAAAGTSSTQVASTSFVQDAIGGSTTISAAGTGSTTLTAAQVGFGTLYLGGALTGARTLIMPAGVKGHWTVINGTTGSFSITIKYATGSSVVITQGTTSNIFGDATNIGLQQTDFISPVLTGVPLAPTPTSGDNSTQLATTAFVQTASNGMLTKSVAGGATVTLTAAEAGNAILKFTGALTASISVVVPNTSASWRVINGTTGAFTLTVKTAAGTGIAVTQGLTWGVICDGTNVIDGLTDFFSVALTGVPTAPTAAAGNNTTQLATTAFVAALGGLKADLASPALTGTPTAPTAAAGTNTTQLATTAFVAALGSLKANNASPGLTGVPTAPTAAAGNNSTQLATTAFVAAGLATKQDGLGFTAVQQGTGVGQLSNLIKLGWSGSKLKATVDALDLGNMASENWVSGAFATLASFSRNMGANGYQMLSGGTIIQWGYNATDAAGQCTFNFPMAFPNAVLGMTVSGRWNAAPYALNAGVGNRSASTGYVFTNYNGAAIGAGFDWFAIGY